MAGAVSSYRSSVSEADLVRTVDRELIAYQGLARIYTLTGADADETAAQRFLAASRRAELIRFADDFEAAVGIIVCMPSGPCRSSSRSSRRRGPNVCALVIRDGERRRIAGLEVDESLLKCAVIPPRFCGHDNKRPRQSPAMRR